MAAIAQQPVVERRPAVSWRHGWRTFICGLLLGSLVPLAAAWFFGPKFAATYEDPLTGRRKHESIWVGLTLSNQVEENEVSRWADRHSIPDIYPGRFGWTPITRTERRWFSASSIACGGGYDIPKRIFDGKIAMDGLTREEILQRYQADIVAAYAEHASTTGAQRKWVASKK
jgi:hypothetical protein